MPAKKSDFDLMSDQLREEIVASVRKGDLLFMPSSEVRREAVRFIRPRSETLTFVKIDDHGNGRDGEGRMSGIGMSPVLVDRIRSSSEYLS
jgi:hypothetical protein